MTDLVCHALIASRVLCILHPKNQTGPAKIGMVPKLKQKTETNSLMNYNMPKPQTDIDQQTDVDEVAFSKLQIRQSDLMEEPVEVTDLLILPLMTKAPEDTVDKIDSNKLSKVERKQEEEEEKH